MNAHEILAITMHKIDGASDQITVKHAYVLVYEIAR